MNNQTRSVPGTFIALLSIAMAGTFLLLVDCNRDNPFDINSPNYASNKKPHVHFIDSAITGYIFDSISIRFTWSDTASGGREGAIKRFFFDWTGSGVYTDSADGTKEDTIVLKKAFTQTSGIARIKAVDFENDTSAVDSTQIEIFPSIPIITSIEAPATVEKSLPFSITVSATSVGSSIQSFHWAINETVFSQTTSTGTLPLTFETPGDKTILVKVSDNKNIESAVRAIFIRVTDPLDTIGPEINFLVPLNLDTLRARNCVVSLQLSDPSGIGSVSVNDVALQLFGATWRGTVPLTEGETILTATAFDGKGNMSTRAIRVVYVPGAIDQNPPVLFLISPPSWDDTVTTSSLTVKILAVDESGVAGLYLNDSAMTLNSLDSSYSTVRNLEAGYNYFIVRSVDRMGNTGFDTLSVFREIDGTDTVPPNITITEPRHLQRIADTAFLSRGTVTDASGIFSLLANGRNAAVNYPDWNVLTNLKHGYDTITVVAVDASTNRNSAEKSVIVIQNRPPRFVVVPNDTFIPMGSVVEFTVTADDDDDSLGFSLLHTPAHSGMEPTLQPDGTSATVSFTAVVSGIDTFRVTGIDPWGEKDTVYWRVFVQSPNDSSPFFTTDAKMLPDTITALDTLRAMVHAEDPNALPLTYSTIRPPTPSGLSIDNNSGFIVWACAEADTGLKTIMLRASNGLYHDTLSWNLVIRPYNWAPVLFFPGHQTINENQQLQLTLQATDGNNDPLEFSFGSTFPVGARLDSNRFSWTPDFSQAGVHTVVFVVRERSRTPSLSDSQTISITVNNVNQKPVLTNPGTITGVVNQTLTYTLIATDPDNNAIAYSMTNAPAGAALNGNRFTWTPTFSQAATHYVNFIARDNGTPPLADTITVSIRINSANGAPVLTNPGNKNIPEMELLQFDLSAVDPNGDSVIYTMTGAPSGATLTGKSFSWRPSYTQAGIYNVTFFAHDNVSPPLSDTQSIVIAVFNRNAPPVLTNPGNQNIAEGQLLSLTLTATDIDNNPLAYSMINAPQGATLSGNRFTWTPSYTQGGSYRITFYVADNAVPALRDSQSITITVNNFNRPPVITDSTPRVMNEQEILSYQLLAYDPDGTPVRFSSPNLLPDMSLTPTGWLWWNPDFSQAGTYNVVIIVRDSSAMPVLSDTATIPIIVNNVNRPPVFTDSAARSTNENQLVSFQLQATDPDGNPARFFATNLPTGAALTLTGAFSWTPTYAQAGAYPVIFIVRDSSSSPVLSDTATIRITVNNINPSAPTLVSPANAAASQPLSLTLRWNNATAASGYHLQVALDTLFTVMTVQDSTITDTLRLVSGLANGTTYYWRVRSLNPGGQSAFSAQRSFSTIIAGPSITTQPASQTVALGATATFTIVAGGIGLSYQWQKNQTNIPNATAATYTTPATTTADNNALFRCVVSNTGGSTTSSSATLTVVSPPAITAHPASLTVSVGSTATFSVTATAGVTYQWEKNGTPIAGPAAQSATYTTPPTTSADNGALFRCVVTNIAGTATSNAATLTVISLPVIIEQPQNATVAVGSSVTFTVSASGAGLTYQWQRDLVPVKKETTASYTIPSAQLTDNGASFRCLITNDAGTTASSAANLTVIALPVITGNPLNLTVVVGAAATFTVTATGTGLTYQWQKDNVNLPGSAAQTASYSILSTVVADNGSYRCVVTDLAGSNVTSTPATLTVIALPVITVNPSNSTVGLGSTATFSVTATGVGLNYQWQKNGTDIDGAVTASYTSLATTMADNGASFRCVVSNIAGPVSSSAAILTVIAPPEISVHPVNTTVDEGTTAFFSIVATGAELTYQWWKNGALIPGAQSNTYTTPVTARSDNGATFACVVTTLGGSETSSAAVLTVRYAPSITTQPASQSVTTGSPVTFSVVASGNPAPAYQWQKDGADISGAIAASYSIASVQLSDAGSYTVVVSNGIASDATSNAAILSVTSPPPVSPPEEP